MRKNSKGRSAKKVRIVSTREHLTSQAGLIPVIRYLDRIGSQEICKGVIPHKCGSNAQYQLSEAVLVTMIGLVRGATSMAKVIGVWADGVLRKVAGWPNDPGGNDAATLVQGIFGGEYQRLRVVESPVARRAVAAMGA